MDSTKIRQSFLDFFRARGHAVVPSSSLIPDDPSVLLTTAGMQQFKKYYTDPAMADRDFNSRNTCSIQKSFRTSDIDEVGDERHLTFFEMMGNFSFGGYFKEDAIRYAHEYLTRVLGLTISYVTVFEGADAIGVPKDEESKKIWRSIDPNISIREEGIDDVFWGPTGTSGPCGPTTEIYCQNGAGQDIEVWNIVFNQYFFPGSREELLSGTSGKNLQPLETPGVDTGMGLERLAMCVQKTKTIFETDLFAPLFGMLPTEMKTGKKRICLDHIRAITFLISDGLRPSNKERDYILRKLIRRVIAIQYLEVRKKVEMRGGPLSDGVNFLQRLLEKTVALYGANYTNLDLAIIKGIFREEDAKFTRILAKGITKLQCLEQIDAKAAFGLYQSGGLPFEAIKDLAPEKTKHLKREDFDLELKKHQEISRAGQERKFGGHGLLLDTGELKAADERELKIVTRLHTATHLLQASLRKVLGPNVRQQGSDITSERTRFDFTFGRKMTPDEIRAVEDYVNDAIRRDCVVEYEEMPYEEAVKTDALRFFREKYPAQVKVYSARDHKTGEILTKEFCGGPHVTHTGEIGRFRIAKEESSAAGIRRIRGVVE
ncbi:MAG: alanine--tRNA ligase-related protein [Patescibacteria group bacterium]